VILAQQCYPATVAPDETHVWVARMSSFAPRERELHGRLDAGEASRAERFRFARDRTNYIIAHGLLREILGRYVDADPSRLDIDKNRYGKPALRTSQLGPALEFNLSHARDVMVLAVTRGREVGIDVEYASDLAFEEIVAECFSARERAALAALRSEDRRAGFFATWTRKEAYAKALGFGIGERFAACDVLDARACERWQVRDIDVPAGYTATVVGALPAWSLQQVLLKSAW